MLGVRVAGLLAAALLLAGCAADARRYAVAAAETQRSVEQLKGALHKAAGAKVCVLMDGSDDEREFPVPAGEWALMRAALEHVVAVPPALETVEDAAPPLPYFAELVFVEPGGGEISGVVVNTLPWMRASEAKQLHPERSRSRYVPEWAVPDADYDTLAALPTISRARFWGIEH